MQSTRFESFETIPYYYPCNFPLIHEVMRSQGSVSSLSLVANARLYGLPSCSSTGLIKTYADKLDYEDAVWTITGKKAYPDFEEGMRDIHRRTSEGELSIVTGTSYYLPYTEDYLNPAYLAKLTEPNSRLYLVDHWLGVVGAVEERVMVYDPVPARYSGPLSLKAFNDFWKGNQAIDALANVKRKEPLMSYGMLDVEAVTPLSEMLYKEMLQSTLATLAHEFLAGRTVKKNDRTYYFGQAVSLQLMKRLHMGEQSYEEAISAISAFVFDMRWSRYFAHDLLQELATSCGRMFEPYVAEFTQIIEQWEDLHARLQGSDTSEKAAVRLEQLSISLEGLLERERRYYERIEAMLAAVPLFRKRQPQRDNPYWNELVRIVLESCQEINQFHGGSVPVELGIKAPLYGRGGRLDSLGLATLLATVEQGIEERLGIAIAVTEEAGQPLGGSDQRYHTVDSFVSFLMRQLHSEQELQKR